MKKWKSLLAAAATAAFLGSVLAGCGGDGTGSGIGIGGGGKDTALSAPTYRSTSTRARVSPTWCTQRPISP